MSFFIAAILAGLAITVGFFRRGGIYNPLEDSGPTGTPPPPPLSEPTGTPVVEPPVAPQTPSKDPVTTFCEAIRDGEGNPGDLNYRNNNPGNCRCSSEGYLPKYGKVLCVNNFAVFETYEIGWEYLKNMVKNKVKKNPNWTFLDFFRHYAPVEDHNNPDVYAARVAKHCKATVDTRVSDYFNGV